MPVQLQVQLRIHCSGHLCIQGQRQQEEEAHQEVLQIREVAVAVKVVAIQAHHRQEEEQDQEERDQEQQDHLHQEEDMEEAVQRRGEPHRSHPAIRGRSR